MKLPRLAKLALLATLCLPATAQTPYSWRWTDSHSLPAQPTLETAPLPKPQRDAIFRASYQAFLADKNFSQQISPRAIWPRAIWQARILLVDLDGDHTPEVILMGGGLESSGDGNASLRILKRRGPHYTILYDGTAEHLNLDPDPKHPTIALYTHDSASEGNLELYRLAPDGTLHNPANYTVTWPTGQSAFTAAPTLEPTTRRALHFNH